MKKRISDNQHFFVAMYLRLSRDDSDIGIVDNAGVPKAESNSISSQRELLRTYIREAEDLELYDCYIEM